MLTEFEIYVILVCYEFHECGRQKKNAFSSRELSKQLVQIEFIVFNLHGNLKRRISVHISFTQYFIHLERLHQIVHSVVGRH